MKKFIIAFLMIILLCLSACIPNDTVANLKDPRLETTSANTSENSTTKIKSEATQSTHLYGNQLPLPKDNLGFSFLSGAGAWQTILTLNRDGTFTGYFLDSDMGDVGEGYPRGSAYTCTFSGKFVDIQKVNAFSYKMTLTDIKTENTVGKEWIENETRYIASEPCGLNNPTTNQVCTEFIFYLPNTPVEQVPDAFLTWWPYRYLQKPDAKTTLSCYGILNVTTGFGFFAP